LCAEGEGPPPPELVAYFNLTQYRIPPRTGGQEMQVAGSLERMTAAANVYYAWKDFIGSSHKVKWQSENPDSWKICKRVMELRENG